MMRYGSCPLPDSADLIVLAWGPRAPMRHRTYRGIHLLRAYRSNARYGSLPMVVVGYGVTRDLPGTGRVAVIERSSDPVAVVSAVDELLSHAADSPRCSS